jgi:WhiB family redox-sensing transcriptional regulator
MSAPKLPDRVRATGDPEWAARGACRDVDPESLFVVGAAQHKAKTICLSCPVRFDCLADALDSRTEFGVWGGMTERERRTLLRRRPDIKSWRAFFSGTDQDESLASLPQALRLVK